MGTLIWLVLLVGTLLTLAYRRTDLRTATVVLGALLVAYLLFGSGGFLWKLLLIALFVLISVAAVTAVDGGGGLFGFFLVSIPAFVAALWWFWIRIYYLPVPALMLEDVGIFGAIERGHALTRNVFWRVFGIALLTAIITSIAGSMLGVPVTMVMDALLSGGLDSQYAALSLTLVNAVSSVVQAAFVAPFTAAVTSLQYVDQRIRKEAFDVELMTRAGITAQ